jgi:hypothetical protein
VESKHPIIFLLLILLISTSFLLFPLAKAPRADAQSSSILAIELGYGPTSLSPLDEGIPVYTTGDSLWVSSYYSQAITFSLVRPDQSQASLVTLQWIGATELYTFTSSDQPGYWNVNVDFGNGTSFLIGIVLTNPGAANASLSQYSLKQNNLNLGFSVQQTGAYNIEGCFASSSTPNSTAFISVPSAEGGGLMRIDSNLLNTSVSDSFKSHAPFTFWYELDYNYTFSGFLTNETITKSLTVARSPTFLFAGNSTNSGQLQGDAPLRPGRYILSAFFDSASGLAVTTTRLLLNGTFNWLWLSGCSPFAISNSNFTSQVSLVQNPSAWPKALYFMYDSQGIEGISTTPLTINLARVDASTEPKNVTLANLNYTISDNPLVQASESFGGSLYVIAKSFPVSVVINPSLGSMALAPQNVTITGPFSETRFFIPVGTLQVHVSNDTKPLSGASVLVTNTAGGELSSITSTQGNATVYLPAGAYNVSLPAGPAGNSQNALISVGKVSSLYFAFSTPPSFTTTYLITALSAMALVGLTLNVWVWRARNRSRT